MCPVGLPECTVEPLCSMQTSVVTGEEVVVALFIFGGCRGADCKVGGKRPCLIDLILI